MIWMLPLRMGRSTFAALFHFSLLQNFQFKLNSIFVTSDFRVPPTPGKHSASRARLFLQKQRLEQHKKEQQEKKEKEKQEENDEPRTLRERRKRP